MRSVVVLALAVGCAPNIAPDSADATTGPMAKVVTEQTPDGALVTIVDATSTEEWIYAEFTTGSEVAEVAAWDLRFQRFHISTNGGVSGAAGVAVAPLAGVAFADVTAAPPDGFVSDAGDGDDANLDPDYAFEQGDGWYDYDPMAHVLTPKPIVWVVRTTGGAHLKLEILRYYDAAGTAAMFKVRWAAL